MTDPASAYRVLARKYRPQTISITSWSSGDGRQCRHSPQGAEVGPQVPS
jgi:hypothetical protein